MKFQSRYGGGTVTPAQYIVEIICEKKAHAAKETLPNRFWDLATWDAFFRKWVRPANKCIKQFGAMSVVNALRDPRSGKRWSLYTEFMLGLIKEHAKKIKEEEKRMSKNKDTVINTPENPVSRTHIPANNMFDLLDVEYSDMSILNGKEKS